MDHTDAVPLPPRPSIEQYRKRAKDLVAAGGSADPDAVREWAAQWLSRLADLHGERPAQVDRRAEEIAAFARHALARARARRDSGALAAAQFVVARVHGFDSWPKLAGQLRSLARPGDVAAAFETAVDAVVAGDVPALGSVLRARPDVIRARSMRTHRATLLHYVSANGVEGYRQQTPPNVVEVARSLLDAGADVDAAHRPEPRHRAGTALGLVATSARPADAGVQAPLMRILLDAGAAVDGVPGAWQPLAAALANGCPDAAALLARRGARLTVVTAAGLGRLDAVAEHFAPDGGYRPDEPNPAWGVPGEPTRQVERALGLAATYGHGAVVEYLLDRGVDPAAQDDHGQTALHLAAHGAHLEVVDLLLRRGAPLELRNAYGGTALGQVMWSIANRADGRSATRYRAVVDRLVAAGALPDD